MCFIDFADPKGIFSYQQFREPLVIGARPVDLPARKPEVPPNVVPAPQAAESMAAAAAPLRKLQHHSSVTRRCSFRNLSTNTFHRLQVRGRDRRSSYICRVKYPNQLSRRLQMVPRTPNCFRLCRHPKRKQSQLRRRPQRRSTERIGLIDYYDSTSYSNFICSFLLLFFSNSVFSSLHR